MAGKAKMQDPIFHKFVDEVVAEVKIEGGFRKPAWHDLIAWKLIILPYIIYNWACKYYRRNISKEPLPLADKIEMSQDRLGMAYWMELSEEEQQKFIDMEIWKQEVFDKFVQEEEAKWERQASSKKGKSKKGSKHLRRRGRREEEEEYDDDYVE